MKRAWRRTSSAISSPQQRPPVRNARRVVGLSMVVVGALGVWWWFKMSEGETRQQDAPPTHAAKNGGLSVKRTASIRIDPTRPPQDAPRTEDPLSTFDSKLPSGQEAPGPMLEPPTSQPKRISITVTDSRGQLVPDAIVESEDCRVFQMTENGMAEIIVMEDACTFQAGRRDGALMAWSDPLFLDLSSRTEAIARLEVPVERTAGMGLQVIPGEGGILVRGVVPGSPAERAGILSGDLITSVEGVATQDLSVREFVELGTGPVGSRVSISITRQTDAAKSGLDFILIRQPIEQAP